MPDTKSEIEAKLGVGHAKRHLPKLMLWGGVAVVVAGLGFWWMQEAEERAQVRYITTDAAIGDLTVTVSATGTIEPTNLVEISSELSSTMADVLVDYNDTVAAGQVLARLDTIQLDAQLAVQIASHAAAEAQLTSAKASLLEAEADFEIVRQLDERVRMSRARRRM
ncbi:biotin/lipoyl-binding protein [Yoonia maritima]|uniref:Biotin/lipoyl-binding protein n=1 Tax=Yoonia maritima TaxID=1435347 RepID=A0A2T0VX87_9RHOB|nr:efflux RND transporter periplasmic adaptor subunit [Yoonia maritima]PRY76350.1 biotin/lipoyl-binding protein [Yoonia maritima]